MHARLQTLKARQALFIARDNFAVDDKVIDWDLCEPTADLGITGSDDRAVSAIQVDVIAITRGNNAHAVILDLENPLRARRRHLLQGGQHGRLIVSGDRAHGRINTA